VSLVSELVVRVHHMHKICADTLHIGKKKISSVKSPLCCCNEKYLLLV